MDFSRILPTLCYVLCSVVALHFSLFHAFLIYIGLQIHLFICTYFLHNVTFIFLFFCVQNCSIFLTLKLNQRAWNPRMCTSVPP